MKVLWNVNQLTFATIGGFIGWFWGGCDGLIYGVKLASKDCFAKY